MAAELDILKGADGALYLVGTVDNAKHVFGQLNASQVSSDRIEQGLDPTLPNATDPIQGAYTGPVEDATASPHLSADPVQAAAPSDAAPPPDAPPAG